MTHFNIGDRVRQTASAYNTMGIPVGTLGTVLSTNYANRPVERGIEWSQLQVDFDGFPEETFGSWPMCYYEVEKVES